MKDYFIFYRSTFKTKPFIYGKKRWLVIAPCFNGMFVAGNSELGKGYSVFVHSYPGEVLLILEFPFEHSIGLPALFFHPGAFS